MLTGLSSFPTLAMLVCVAWARTYLLSSLFSHPRNGENKFTPLTTQCSGSFVAGSQSVQAMLVSFPPLSGEHGPACLPGLPTPISHGRFRPSLSKKLSTN